jgi:replicative DNA helicase
MNLTDDPGLLSLRIPPHSIEAESSVLGSLMLDNRAWDRVADLLMDSDFYRMEHRLIFGAVGALVNSNKEADVVTVYAYLQKQGKDEAAGGIEYLNALAQFVPSASNIRRYADIVRERSILRKLISASDDIATSAFNTEGKAIATILDSAESQIFSIGQQSARQADDWKSLEHVTVKLLDWMQLAAEGGYEPDYTSTGFKELDERLDGGMRGGELIVLGARPSMGKTAMGMNIVKHVAQTQGKPCGVFSMEMPDIQVTRRLMSTVGKIRLDKVRRPERLNDFDWASVSRAVESMRTMDISFVEQGGLNINQIRSKARGLARRKGQLGAIMLDYFSLITGTDPKIPRAYQLQEASMGLKSLAKELNCPVIVLQQVKRDVEGRADQMPVMSDLKDSGSLEQDADAIIFVHRPAKADAKLGDEWKHLAQVSVPKLRDGETGFFNLYWAGENQAFVDWPATLEVPSNRVRTSRGGDL